MKKRRELVRWSVGVGFVPVMLLDNIPIVQASGGDPMQATYK